MLKSGGMELSRISQKGILPKPMEAAGGTAPGSGKMKRLTLDIPEALHREIKKNAAHEGVTMAEKLRALLLEHYGLAGDDAGQR